MREIKFRGWIKESQKMVRHLESKYYEQWFTKRQDCLMQYTGLKDKNGVEIYEGDIIDYTMGPLYKNLGIVAFCGGSYYLYCKDCLLGRINIFDSLEVRGNIYENPELLMDSQ